MIGAMHQSSALSKLGAQLLDLLVSFRKDTRIRWGTLWRNARPLVLSVQPALKGLRGLFRCDTRPMLGGRLKYTPEPARSCSLPTDAEKSEGQRPTFNTIGPDRSLSPATRTLKQVSDRLIWLRLKRVPWLRGLKPGHTTLNTIPGPPNDS